MELNYQIEDDGSFSLYWDNQILLSRCYPGVDDGPIRPIRTRVDRDRGSAEWDTEYGTIRLKADCDGNSAVRLDFSISENQKPMHVFWPVCQGSVPSAEGFYQASGSLGGDTGYYNREDLQKAGTVLSHGLGSIQYPGQKTLTLFDELQDRYETLLLASVHSKMRDFPRSYRADPVDPQDGMEIAVGYRVECTGRGSFAFPPLILMAGERMQDDLETAARRIGKAMHARLSMPPVYHWCSWYYCYHNFDLPQLSEYLDGLAGMNPKIPIRYIQIDAGYFPSAGDWLEPNSRFPHGLEEAFRMIRDAGYLPGIWIAPYMVGNRSRLYREHPDWILYDVNDRPVRGVISDNEPKPWGYQDEEYYILDTSHPDAMNYLKHVFEAFYAWGARLFKTDFMVWGLQDSTAVKRHTPGKTSVEYFRDFLKMVRSVIGDESYWLGCIAPFMPFIGYADGMRIGNDVGSSWNGEFGPKNMIRCLTGNNFANHNFYQTDPDAVMLRDFQIRLTGTELRSLALLAGLSGGCIYTSDPLHLIAKDRADLFRYIRPDRRRKPYLPYLQQKRDDLVMVYPKEEKGRGLLFLFNTGEGTVTNRYSLKDLGFSETDSVTDMESEKREETLHGEFTVTLEKHASRLCLVSEEKNPAIDHENLWKNL